MILCGCVYAVTILSIAVYTIAKVEAADVGSGSAKLVVLRARGIIVKDNR